MTWQCNDFPVALHNGSPTPENNQFAGQFTIDQAGTQLNQFSIAGSQLSNGDLNYAPTTTYFSAHNISTFGSFPINGGGDEQAFRVKGNLSVQFPNLTLNDTTSFYQPFFNFYSYDDGSAEAAFGPTGTQARLAIDAAYRVVDVSEKALTGVNEWRKIELSQGIVS